MKEHVVKIKRCAAVVKGGRRFSFTALVVIGDGNGRVGLGYGKAKEVPLAIQKGTEEARRNLFTVPLAGSTIVHPVIGETGMLERFMGVPDTAENRARFVSTIPLGRMSRPEDIANAAVFLAEPASEFITGVCIEVDGGRCV